MGGKKKEKTTNGRQDKKRKNCPLNEDKTKKEMNHRRKPKHEAT